MAKSSNPSEFAWPNDARDAVSVAVAPEANRAVNETTSSFSTGSRTSLSSARAWPTTAPSGTARSVTTVESTAPRTDSTGPHRNSARSTAWLPMSASAPEPGPPL